MKRWLNILAPLYSAPDDAGADIETAAPPDADAATDDAEAMSSGWQEEDWAQQTGDLDDDHEFIEDLKKHYADEPEEEAEAEVEAEPVAEESEESEDADKPVVDFSLLREMLPESVIESEEDARTHIERLRTSDQAMQVFESLAEGDDALVAYIELRKQGKTPRLAAIEAFAELTEVPDPDEDPEEYADWKAEQAVKAEREKHANEQRSRTEKEAKERAKAAQQVFDASMKRNGWTEDHAERIALAFQQMTAGDPNTGRFRGDTFEIVDKGLRYDDTVKAIESVVSSVTKIGAKAAEDAEGDSELTKSVKAAIRSAFAAGVKRVRDAEAGIRSGVNLVGSRKAGRDLSAHEKELRDLGRSFEKQGVIDQSWG